MKKKIVLILLMIFLDGCYNVYQNSTSSPETNKTLTHININPYQTTTPVYTELPTILSITPNIITPTSSSVPAQDTLNGQYSIINRCLKFQDTFPKNWNVSGIIPMNSNVGNGGTSKDYLLNLKDLSKNYDSGEKQNQYGYFSSVSLDNKWVSYKYLQYDEKKNLIDSTIVVSSPDKRKVIRIPTDSAWIGTPSWIDAHHLILLGEDLSANEANATSLISIDPFTLAHKTLPTNFPDIYQLTPLPNWNNLGIIAYDPTLSRVVYLADNSDDGVHLVLWNTVKNRIIKVIQIYTTGDVAQGPLWTSEGLKYVLTLERTPLDQSYYDIFSMDKDGVITKLTQLSNMYEYTQINHYSWSKDGRYLAFWFVNENSNKYSEELAFVDTTTLVTTRLCLNGMYEISGEKEIAPVWSPDGNLFIINRRISNEESNVILINPHEGIGVQIDQNVDPGGWLIP
jgi:hypothetical protein